MEGQDIEISQTSHTCLALMAPTTVHFTMAYISFSRPRKAREGLLPKRLPGLSPVPACVPQSDEGRLTQSSCEGMIF